MLRTFAAFSLGTVAVTTAVASIATTTERGKDDANVRPVPARVTDSLAATAAPAWRDGVASLIERGVLEDIEASIEKAGRIERQAADGVIPEIRPAVEIPKKPNHEITVPLDRDGNIAATGRIQLKFRNGLGARASIAGISPVLSMAGADMAPFNQLVAAEGATVRQMINHPEAVIEDIRRKAFERSGRVQPDLAAMMYVELPGIGKGPVDWDRVLRVAHAFNDMPELEWVSLERIVAVHQQADCDPMNPVLCNRPNPGVGADCWDGDVNSIAAWPGACNPAPGDDMAALTACADVNCCQTVGGLVPYCDDAESGQGWDVYCAAVANSICQGTVYDLTRPDLTDRYDPCLSNYNPALFDGGDLNYTDDPAAATRLAVFTQVAGLLLDSCYEPHQSTGCNQPACCASVCVVDPACCADVWDQNCADIASSGDIAPCDGTLTPDPTPLYSELTVDANFLSVGIQAYLTEQPFNNPFDPQPGDANDTGTFPRFSGFTGGGLDIIGSQATVGIIWRLYGGGAVGGASVIPNPNLVWMDGAEFEVVPASECTTGDCIAIDPTQPRSYDNPFPGFAVDANYPYGQIRLRPTGRTSQVAVCEFSAIVNHEEWCRDTPDGEFHPSSITVEEGQTLTFFDPGNFNHGTACLGTTVARDNDFGVIGIAPRAQGFFYPIESLEEGSRAPTAMASMIRDLEPGAVINHSWGPTALGECLTANEPAYSLIRASADAGLVVCISAGNDGAPLVAEANAEVNSGAIIVGAREPGSFWQNPEYFCFNPRRINFSTFSSEELSVTCNAWGIMGTTPGYGDLFQGEDNRPGLNFIERQYTRSYTGPTPLNFTGGFNGTSFASPQVAGACALIQGASMMFWDTTLNSDIMQGILSGPPGNCQDLGYPPDCPYPGIGYCGDNLSIFGDPAGIQSDVGPVVSLPAAMVSTLTSQSDPTGGSFVVHHGTLLSGNAISLSAADNNAVVIRSEFAAQGPGPDGLTYYGTGPSIDFGMTLTVGGAPADLGNLEIQTTSKANNTVVVEMVFAKNLVTGRWVPQGVELLTTQYAGHNYPLGFDIGTEPYLSPANEVSLRVYALGLGFVNGGSYDGAWDLVTITIPDGEPL